MPQPVPELQEILALEAKIHADKYDLSPFGMSRYMEALLSRDVIYIKN